MSPGRAVVRAGSTTLLVLLASACGSEFVPPTTGVECAEAAHDVDDAASSDVSSMWTMAYSDEGHPLGSSGTLYLCIENDPELEAWVTADAPPGIEVDPDPLTVPTGAQVIEELVVTVTSGDEVGLPVTLDMGQSGGTITVYIDVDDDEWSFGERLGGS